MAKFKTITINTVAAIVAILCIIGMLNMHTVVPLIDYVNDHTSGGMAFLYYGGTIALLFLFPLIIGAAIEVPMWESNTRIGQEVSNAMHNARNGIVPFVAVGLFGGMVTFFSTWGVIAMICG